MNEYVAVEKMTCTSDANQKCTCRNRDRNGLKCQSHFMKRRSAGFHYSTFFGILSFRPHNIPFISPLHVLESDPPFTLRQIYRMNGQTAYIAAAGPSSSSSITGDHEQLPQTQTQSVMRIISIWKSSDPVLVFSRKIQLPDGHHSAVVCDHLWQRGWQRGEYSDVEVRVR